MIWIIILALLLVAAIVGLIYLDNRICHFFLIQKAANGNKKLMIVLSALVIILITVVTALLLNIMNAIICLLHLVAFWLLSDLIMWIITKVRKKPFRYYYAGIIAIVTTVVYLSVGWYLAHHVWMTTYALNTDKEVGSLRVVQFADSHVGATFDGKDLQKYIDEMQALNPDVVVITGDYVVDDTSKEDMIAACEALGTLKTTYGVYYSFGNHDKGYYGPEFRGYNGDDLIAELEKNGVTVLQDESVLIDNRFYLIGRQDRSETERGESRASMKELVEPLDSSKYMIVLDHQPHDYQNQADAGVDLVLSGHTHGGQLLPFNYVGEWTGENDMTYGLRSKDHTNYIVTSGISDWAIKFKTGCKSEYVVVDVKENN